MTIKRRKYTSQEKAKIALEALSGRYTLNELTTKYSIHGSQINIWKKRLKETISSLFEDRRNKSKDKDKEDLMESLYQQIGQLTMELEWLKKKSELFK